MHILAKFGCLTFGWPKWRYSSNSPLIFDKKQTLNLNFSYSSEHAQKSKRQPSISERKPCHYPVEILRLSSAKYLLTCMDWVWPLRDSASSLIQQCIMVINSSKLDCSLKGSNIFFYFVQLNWSLGHTGMPFTMNKHILSQEFYSSFTIVLSTVFHWASN